MNKRKILLGSYWTLCLLIILFIHSNNIFAEELCPSDWMKNIPSDISISELSIPGTHESAATKGIKIPLTDKDYGKCQYGPYQIVIKEQLNMGCRYLNNQEFAIHHGDIYQNLMFGDILSSCQEFLNQHPTETIFMRVKQEKSSVSNQDFKSTFFSYVNRYPNLFWNNKQNKIPKLGEVRGKIVVLYNVAGLDFGLNYSQDFEIQDNYDTSSVETKWQSFFNHLKQIHSKPSINYLSATGNWKKTPEDLARELNPRFAVELQNTSQNYTHLGTIATDFMTKELASKIWGVNFKSVFNFYGIGTPSGNTHFAQLCYNGNYTCTLHEGIEMHGAQIHPYFQGNYASIVAKDKNGTNLFTKECELPPLS